MTQDEWNRDNAKSMLRHLTRSCSGDGWLGQVSPRAVPLVSDRKLRLFACACCRHAWGDLGGEARSLLGMVEDAADSFAGRVDATSRSLQIVINLANGAVAGGSARLLNEAAACCCWDYFNLESSLQCLIGNLESFGVASRLLAASMRDVCGDPFRQDVSAGVTVGGGSFSRPLALPMWVDRQTSDLASLAYRDRAPDGSLDGGLLLALSDAMEEGGCNDRELLAHLRSPGRHFRGMWSLDAIIGHH